MNETQKIVAAAGLLLILGPLVLFWTRRSLRQISEARGIYKELAELIGAQWSPPKNAHDTLGPGRVRGRYRDRKVTIDSTVPSGAARNLLPSVVIRVHFQASLGLGLHAGSGTFRARNPGELELESKSLQKLLRPKAKDEAGARRLLAGEAVTTQLLALAGSGDGIGLDDGTLSFAMALPTTVAELQAALDRVIDTIAVVS